MSWLLLALIVLPFTFGIIAGIAGARRARWIAVAGLVLELAGVIVLWLVAPHAGDWLARLDWVWIPRFGIHFLLAADGLSVILIGLTAVVGLAAVIGSWNSNHEHSGFFYFSLLATLTGVVGVFLALDLFLFFFFWELMLIPMYFIIAAWGHENRSYSALKFVLFTQASSLLLLAAIIVLALVHQQHTGVLTFSYFKLLGTPLPGWLAMPVMLGFFVAFAVKLSVVPLHSWLPDAYTDAPTGGSIILAGILAKTGAYGMIRFLIPLFPHASASFAPVGMALAVTSILYGASMAFAQRDFKRLVAYSSVSHMGFVLLGIYAWTTLALQGVVMQIVAHGLGIAALFMIAGSLRERLDTSDMDKMGGLWTLAPRLGALGLFFAIAALGLPGLASFIGEFLILAGTYKVSIVATAFAAAGFVFAVIYALWLVQRSFHGAPPKGLVMADTSMRETFALGVLAALLVLFGFWPSLVLNLTASGFQGLAGL